MNLLVTPHKVKIINKQPINEKEINISRCSFVFSQEYTNDLVKEATFTYGDKSYKEIIVNNECDIPYEVLDTNGIVEVGVVAYKVVDDEYIKRYNPTPAYFRSLVGSLKPKYENSKPITPSELEQFEQALEDGLQEVANVDIDATETSSGATITITNRQGTQKSVNITNGIDGKDGKDGADGKDGKDGVNGKDGINGKDGKDGIDGKDGKDGKDGTNGTNGQDGHSPVVTATKTNKTTTIYVDGSSIATINDGADGQDGSDYVLTNQDKTDIANIVIGMLPTWTGGSY